MGALAALLSLATGYFGVGAALRLSRRDWRCLALGLAAGWAAGAGISSVAFFVLTFAGIAKPAVVIAVDLALLAGAAVWWWRTPPLEPERARASGLQWGLAFAILLAAGFAAGTFTELSTVFRHGGWDAWSIWNVRAKYLAEPSSAGLAVSPELTRTHPAYPALLSALHARGWMYSGARAPGVPALHALFFAAALPLLLCGFLALRRSPTVALAATVPLLANFVFLEQAPMQYADIPLALYILAAVALGLGRTAAEWAAAGAMAGLAAWTKNEGLAFAAVFALLLLAWRRHVRQFAFYVAGAAPALLLVAWFKLFLAPGTESLFAQGLGNALSRLDEPSRYGAIAASLTAELLNIGDWYTHPLLLLAVLGFGLGWRRDRLRETALPALTTAVMLAVYVAVYLVTPEELGWHLGTSMGRLLLHLWALVALAVGLAVHDIPAAQAAAGAGASRQHDHREKHGRSAGKQESRRSKADR